MCGCGTAITGGWPHACGGGGCCCMGGPATPTGADGADGESIGSDIVGITGVATTGRCHAVAAGVAACGVLCIELAGVGGTTWRLDDDGAAFSGCPTAAATTGRGGGGFKIAPGCTSSGRSTPCARRLSPAYTLLLMTVTEFCGVGGGGFGILLGKEAIEFCGVRGNVVGGGGGGPMEFCGVGGAGLGERKC
jgi:hypothetical protein